MRKLAFEFAGSFEMPELSAVNVEKETSHIAFANVPNTVYEGSASGFSRSAKLRMALEQELEGLDLETSAL
ncbi:MAG: hypothetical protein IJD36_04660 [Clostridia bacterium]|nr:hypothetical protein [Clostridia bacterium]